MRQTKLYRVEYRRGGTYIVVHIACSSATECQEYAWYGIPYGESIEIILIEYKGEVIVGD